MSLPAFLTGSTTGNKQPTRPRASLLLPIAAALLVTSCGTGSKTAAATANPEGVSAGNQPFKPHTDWSFLADLPRTDVTMKTQEECLTQPFWEDEDGKRQPPVQADPLVLTIDSSCNTPLTSDVSGVYYTPEQSGPAPIKVRNGDPAGVDCVYTTEGQPNQDIRGASSSTSTWLGIVVFQDGELKEGLYPENMLGYIDEALLPKCEPA